jgi:type VI secretion system secreted protein VgrG
VKDIFSISSSSLPDTTRLVSFRGTEALCRPYEFEIFFILKDEPDFDMADAIGAKATLQAHRDDGRDPFVFHGVIATIKHLHETDGRALYRIVLVPRLWQLSLTRASRVYTKQSVPDIIKAALEAGDLASDEFELRLDGTYAVEEHVCQYQESHLDFVHRWMEREGLYYFFEQGEDHELMVITDHRSFHDKLDDKAVRYHPLTGSDVTAAECFDSFTCQHASMPASVRLSDYDYSKPTVEMVGTAPVSPTGTGEISVYGSRFFTVDEGKRLAKVRAEELLVGQVLGHAEGTALYLRPGYTFDLEDHPRDAFNKTYLATQVRHFGNQSSGSPEVKRFVALQFEETYRVEVTAILADVQFRAARVTAWPRIYGYENGTVDGEADSEYAQIDDQGRYAVKFKFDESDLKDGKASTWVRMLQPHGGSLEGFHFPLRKNTEVLFTFLGGDPDRPVIAGVVPNAHTPSPVTSANNTTNVIQTGGRNRFELEDKQGSERITLQTPHTNTMIRMGAENDDHNLICRTDGTTLLDSRSHWDVRVGGHLDEDVTQAVKEVYHSTKEETVTGAVTEKYDAGQKTTVSGGARELQVTGDLTEHCTGTAKQDYDAAHNLTTGPRVDHIKGTLGQTADGAHTLTTGARTDTINGTLTQTATGAITITAPAITQTATGPTSFFTNATKAEFTYGAKFSADLSVSLSLFAGVKLSAEAAIAVSATAGLKAEFGGALNVRASPLQVTLGAAMTTIAASGCVDVVTPCLMVPAASIVLL